MDQCARERPRGRWVYVPAPDEIPVTFQIGMVGSDGVLLASDRAHTRPDSVRTTFSAEKLTIISSESSAYCYCCAGDDYTQMIADRICRLEKPEHTSAKEFFLLKASLAFEKLRASFDAYSTGPSGSIFLACGSEYVDLIRISLHGKQDGLTVEKIDNRDFAGDGLNPAAFFIERYLPSGKYVKLPLEKLKLIAVHTILMASELNPVGIHGIDIVLCPHGKSFRELDLSEIEKLTQDSRKLDSTIADMLNPSCGFQ